MAKKKPNGNGLKLLGRGIHYTVEGHTLRLECDLSPQALKSAPPSSTGKSRLPVKTDGWVDIPEVPGLRVMVQGQVGYQGPAPSQSPTAAA